MSLKKKKTKTKLQHIPYENVHVSLNDLKISYLSCSLIQLTSCLSDEQIIVVPTAVQKPYSLSGLSFY